MNPITFLVQHLMLPTLTWSYDHIYPNYAVSIILLTAMVKLVFYPLSQKQFSSMKKMSAIQPQLKAVQAKYKEDPKRMQVEMMALYKENNVNPLGGCLPLLVQMPFLIALFYSLSHEQFKQILQTPGVHGSLFWISDLSLPDHFYVLPVLIGLSTWISQKLSSSAAAPMEPMQKMMMGYIPFLMAFISWKLPSGVGLYWVVSQVLGAAQQYWVMRPEAPHTTTIIKQGS